ncbi:uncharacterized protein LKV04_001742 [Tautogolabrus adspersus]
MEKIYFIAILLLGALWETAAMSITGVSGQKIEITCSHTYASSNVKYFCKGACNNEDILITSRKMDSREKYSIKDKGNTFYVSISHLTVDDSGTYWCGIERTGVDMYNKVVLTVKEAPQGNPTKDMPQSKSSSKELSAYGLCAKRKVLSDTSLLRLDISVSEMMVYIGAGLGVVVLALAIFLLIFFKYRNRDVCSSKGKVQDTVYATMSNMTQDGHVTSSSTAANKAQNPDTSRDLTDNIYSNVNVSSEPQVQSDALFYSTVSFKRRNDCSPVTPRTEGVTYSTIECKSTDTSTHAYSSV